MQLDRLGLLMTTYNERGEVEPGRVIFQVKATDRLRVLKDGKTISFPVERQHLKQWLRENDPVILVVYDGARDRAFWLYVQAMLETFNPKSKVTYAQLHLFLRGLGFKDRLVNLPERPECHVFWHPDIELSFHLAVRCRIQ